MKSIQPIRISLIVVLAASLGLVACDRNDLGTPFDSVNVNELGKRDHEYERVDRMGMPAIATAVITSKDDYNQADPTDDANLDFVNEIVGNIDFLHTALDDDLTNAGLTPCATNDCVNQAAPLVVPDVIKIDTMQPAGFPNGRRLTDPVIDVTLALVLLDLGTHGVDTLIGLNPTANDKPFLDDFPYLRPANRGKGRTIQG